MAKDYEVVGVILGEKPAAGGGVLLAIGFILYAAYQIMGGLNEVWGHTLVYFSYFIGFLPSFFGSSNKSGTILQFLSLYGATLFTLLVYVYVFNRLRSFVSLPKAILIFPLVLLKGSIITYAATKDSSDKYAHIDRVSDDLTVMMDGLTDLTQKK